MLTWRWQLTCKSPNTSGLIFEWTGGMGLGCGRLVVRLEAHSQHLLLPSVLVLVLVMASVWCECLGSLCSTWNTGPVSCLCGCCCYY